MEQLNQASVYQSLTQPPMLLGLPQTATFMGGGAIFLAVVASGYNPLVIVGAALVTVITLPFLRRMFEREPFMMDILPGYFTWPSYMPHHSRMSSTVNADSVPKSPYG